MPIPSNYADFNFAMSAPGVADQTVLDQHYGDGKVPIASGNGVHVMGLTADGTGIIVRFSQANWSNNGQNMGFALYYNNDARNPGGSDAAQIGRNYGHSWNPNNTGGGGWQNARESNANGRIANSTYMPSTVTGPREVYVYRHVISSSPSHRQVVAAFLADGTTPMNTPGDVGMNSVNHGSRPYTGNFLWTDEVVGNAATMPNSWIDIKNINYTALPSGHGAGTLEDVVTWANDPGFEYVLKFTGNGIWEGHADANGESFSTAPAVSFAASVLHVPPMQLVYPVTGLAASDRVIVHKNNKIILPASYTVANEEISFTEEGVSVGDVISVTKVK